ncbi:aminopeptidase P family protein [Amycolatopsis sp. WAC 04169]|uniref:aminopeptidase P family protein n=1 Tax=Amycolatopsis sp. WAC 04169 TaxID=2203197 RepID=UPI001F38D174|nr:aminopeptidase P family protein [Amycolatopsis sp. WAC 04169]
MTDNGKLLGKERQGRLSTASRRIYSEELLEFMCSGWAETSERNSVPAEQSVYTAKRRQALSAAFAGERLVIPAGIAKTRVNDTKYGFRPTSEYVFLTGDRTEGAVLVFEPNPAGGHDEQLYLLPRMSPDSSEFWLSGRGELEAGRRRSLTETAGELGLAVEDIGRLPTDLTEAVTARPGVPSRLLRGHDVVLDTLLAELEPDRRGPREVGKSIAAEQRDQELKANLAAARLVKDVWEIDQLRRACESTMRGFDDVVAELDQAIAAGERWVEGTFWRRARVDGNDVGYTSVCAAGAHACSLHWVRNDGPIRLGELLLLDAGVETDTFYTADVTRTFPISGTFTELQRKIYDAVHDALEAAIAAVEPGARFRDYHEAAERTLAERLVEWGLLEGPAHRVLELGLSRRYTLHGAGHMIGLDVHDCSGAPREDYVDGVLKAGMVLTVEPGLYFQPDDLTVPEQYRGIGVRIEDDILVTEDGRENLTAALPRSADEVENWVRSKRRKN